MLTLMLIAALAGTAQPSESDGSVAADGDSREPTVSGDGRLVAFASSASNLDAADGNGEFQDVFLHDRATGVTRLVSLTPAGASGNGPSVAPHLSADGRVLVFVSAAPDLVEGDGNGALDVFVTEVGSGVIQRVTRGHAGGDADGPSHQPRVSADGRYVVFSSTATNLVAGDTNGTSDVFLFDRVSGATELLTRGADGSGANGPSNAPDVSADGSVVVFHSGASNLGPADENGRRDVYRLDRGSGEITRVSIPGDGIECAEDSVSPRVSGDGTRVVFESFCQVMGETPVNPGPNVYLYERGRRGVRCVSLGLGGVPADNHSRTPVISGDGQVVAFQSLAGNLVEGDGNDRFDVFTYSVADDTLKCVSVATGDHWCNGDSAQPALSMDGTTIVVATKASDLFADDGNKKIDIAAWSSPAGPWMCVSVGGAAGAGVSEP